MSNNNQEGIGFLGLLGIVFIILKLTDVIDWSWWWVTLPLWGGAALGLSVFVLVLLWIGSRSRDNDDRW